MYAPRRARTATGLSTSTNAPPCRAGQPRHHPRTPRSRATLSGAWDAFCGTSSGRASTVYGYVSCPWYLQYGLCSLRARRRSSVFCSPVGHLRLILGETSTDRDTERGAIPPSQAEAHTHLAHSVVRYVGAAGPADLVQYGLNSAGDLVDLISRVRAPRAAWPEQNPN